MNCEPNEKADNLYYPTIFESSTHDILLLDVSVNQTGEMK